MSDSPFSFPLWQLFYVATTFIMGCVNAALLKDKVLALFATLVGTRAAPFFYWPVTLTALGGW